MYIYVKIFYNFRVTREKLGLFFRFVPYKVFNLQKLLKPIKKITGYHKNSVLFVYY